MKITSELTDASVLRILGERISRHRLQSNLTQAELAAEAGVGKRTLERIEAGGGAELTTFVRVLRALGLLEGLDELVAELPLSPIAQIKLQGKQRQRASRRRDAKPKGPSNPWTWGEE